MGGWIVVVEFVDVDFGICGISVDGKCVLYDRFVRRYGFGIGCCWSGVWVLFEWFGERRFSFGWRFRFRFVGKVLFGFRSILGFGRSRIMRVGSVVSGKCMNYIIVIFIFMV